MIWLRGLIGARWFLPVLIAVLSAVSGACGWFYMKGYNDCTADVGEKSVEALQDDHTAQVEALESKSRREAKAHEIGDIPRPDVDLCDAGGVWLHSIQDAVRAANAAGEPDGAPAATD